ncbi:MAG: N-acetyl sugar amidotransferase [Verrucomicrobiota bacterium]
MKLCRRCLYPSFHPLGIDLDKEEVCSGCRVHDEKDQLDWAQRWTELEQLIDGYRGKDRLNYDCVIPVSGARDSFFIVHTVKKKLGLNPLLVTYNKQYNTAVGIRNLARLRTELDCDIFTSTVDPDSVKRITRATMMRFGSMYWHCLAGQTVYPVQVAVKFKIPLIIWGHHQGLDQVGMYSHLDKVEMTRRYRRNHDLMRREADDLVSDYDFVKPSDVKAFLYPHDQELSAVGVRGIYLGNYMRWDTKAQHESMIDLYDYEAVPSTRTFDTYNDVDCWMHSDVHDYIKWCKWGYGRARDHAVRELRFNRISRKRALELALEYEVKPPRHLDLFLDWIGIDEKGFELVINQHRSPKAWHSRGLHQWQKPDEWLKAENEILAAEDEAEVNGGESCSFRVRKSDPICDAQDKFILIGKGNYRKPQESDPLVISK